MVTQSTVRMMEAAVDGLAGMVEKPQMMVPTRALRAIEDRICRTSLALVRHLAAVVGSVAAGIWGTIENSAEADVGVAIAAALVMPGRRSSLAPTDSKSCAYFKCAARAALKRMIASRVL